MGSKAAETTTQGQEAKEAPDKKRWLRRAPNKEREKRELKQGRHLKGKGGRPREKEARGKTGATRTHPRDPTIARGPMANAMDGHNMERWWVGL